jgi:hypothetical protein
MNTTIETTAAGKLTAATFTAFALAGRAVFTAVSPTGARFTYRIAAKKVCDGRGGGVHFVSVLTGSDNEADYTFIGTIFGGEVFRASKHSRIDVESKSVQAFGWIWRHRSNPAPVEVHHEGRCGRCGRTLTVPSSIESGLGPECARMAGG